MSCGLNDARQTFLTGSDICYIHSLRASTIVYYKEGTHQSADCIHGNRVTRRVPVRW